MNKLIDYFINKASIVNILTAVILLAGLMSVFRLQKETFPTVDFEIIIIRANFPGASAEDVEKLVSIPFERELKEVDGIEEMNVLSGEGYSIVVLKVDQDYKTDDVLEDARNAIDGVNDLPTDVEKPYIKKMVNSLRPIIKIAIKGDSEWELRQKATDLRDVLERVPGVAKVNFEGYRDEQIDVAVNPEKLKLFEITMAEVTSAIRDRNINVAGGTIRIPEQEVIVRTMTEFKNYEDIKRVVVRSNASGSNIKIQDIADVKSTLNEDQAFYRNRGEKSVIVQVVAKSRADVIKTTDLVKNKAEDFFAKIDKTKITHEYQDELAFYVKRRLSVLTSNGIQGLILVFLCLLAFMNFRVSLMTSLGAPLAFLVSFILMESFGISINLISMFGLILVLGMLVDDSIIVAENFYQKIEKGIEPRIAAQLAAKESLAPVSATIVTTMIAFGALFFMSGIMGKFLWPVPAVVIICLSASWIECFFFLPSHLSDFVRIDPKGMEKDRWYKPILNKYVIHLKKFLAWKKLTVLGFVGLFVISILVFINMKKEMFPGDDAQILFVKIKGKVGVPKSKTNEAVATVEKIIIDNLKEEEFESLSGVVGTQRSDEGTTKIGTHYGQLVIYLTMQDFRDRKTDDLITLIGDKTKNAVAGFDISMDKRAGGPPMGKPVNILLYGDKIEDLIKYSKIIKNIVQQQKGVLVSEIDYEEGKQQYIVKINEEEARRHGLTNTQVAMEIRRAFAGEIATEIRKSSEDINVMVRLNELARSTDKSLDDLYILNNFQRRIKLTQVAKIEKEPGSFVIRRFNRKRTFQISAEIDKKNGANSVLINKDIEVEIDKILKDTDLTYELAGENKDTQESFVNFQRATLVSLCLIFLVLVIMFSSLVQPLIVMSAIPLALIGVIFIFKLFGMPISFMAMMGIIGLVGVVVNDSIVLVDCINNNLKENVDNLIDTIAESCRSRFRPVILTTFTTVAGLLPIAHMPGGDPFLKPMAISFAYGLLFSTSLTLIFVPSLYLIYVEFINRKKIKS